MRVKWLGAQIRHSAPEELGSLGGFLYLGTDAGRVTEGHSPRWGRPVHCSMSSISGVYPPEARSPPGVTIKDVQTLLNVTSVESSALDKALLSGLWFPPLQP